MMKVLYINTVFERGSTGKIVKQLGDSVVTLGGDYVVAYGRGIRKDNEHSYYIGSKMDRYVHAITSRFTDKAGFYSTKSTNELIRFIRQYNPDIIHLHNLHGYYINIRILFNYLKTEFKGRIVWTLHDCWPFTGHCTHYTYAKCEKWKTLCSICGEKKSYPKSVFLDNSKENYQEKRQLFTGINNLTIVTVSDWLKHQVEQSFLNQYPIRRIYNGIDTDFFRQSNNDLREKYNLENKRVILSVSDGWNERKGFNVIINVSKEAPKDWIFIVIGLSKQQIKELPENIIGITKTWNQKELIDYYSIADVLFNPSIEETFGLVTAEAMSCETPAVVFNSTASPELIMDENVGAILDINSSISEIIQALSANYDGELARRVVCESFDQGLFRQQYMSVYEEAEG